MGLIIAVSGVWGEKLNEIMDLKCFPGKREKGKKGVLNKEAHAVSRPSAHGPQITRQ